MRQKGQGQHRERYTLDFELQAVQLVKAELQASGTAHVLGMPKQSLSN